MKEYKIAINGFFGKMGQSIYNESKKFPDCQITVGCDLQEKIKSNSIEEVSLTSNISDKADLFDSVIDFSLPQSTIKLIDECQKLKKPITIGTTGFTSNQLNQINKASNDIPILLAPNMSYGVNATFSIIAELAKILNDYKITINETHHKNKIDKPSGTAIKLASIISENSPTIDTQDQIKINSSRVESEIGTHEVVFENDTNKINIIHSAFDRSIFAIGAIKTAMWITNQEPGLYNYQNFLTSKS
tara:strand:- start:20488 stop:21225 length:738 start_codon:yes stop_codon:yes gene_type:complete